MKPLYILKIGGSVATFKNRQQSSIRTQLLKKIARQIKLAKEQSNFDLIIIHGAGSFGHTLAQEFGLKEGTGKDSRKWYGAIISRVANHKLDLAISEIFAKEGLFITPSHTASVIVQKDKKIKSFSLDTIKAALKNNCIPMLYGEMVFDEKLGMSICSGDAIAPYLAIQLKARKIFFASDIDGIFTSDPYVNKDAKLIEKIDLNKIEKDVLLSESHNVDTTSGLLGKIKSLKVLQKSFVQTVEIFNGLKEENYAKIFNEENFLHTKIIIKK